MPALVTNNAAGTLASSLGTTATAIILGTGQGASFPNPTAGQYFYATLVNAAGAIEIVKVTARSADVLTAARGAENTTALAWNSSDRCELRVTAALLASKVDADAPVLTGSVTVAGNIAATGTVTAAGFVGPLIGSVTGILTGSVSGTAANVTGTVAIANGGTGATTAAAALAALGGLPLTGGTLTGTAIAAGFVGPLTGAVTGTVTGNVTGNVSGTAANVTGVVAIANGGTGAPTAAAALAALGGAPLAGATFTGAVVASAVSDNAGNLRDVAQNTQNAVYTLALTDRGGHIYKSGSSATTWTIPLNTLVALPVGTAIGLVNDGAGLVTISPAGGVTLQLASNGSTGNRSLPRFCIATLLKVATDTWYISGVGLT